MGALQCQTTALDSAPDLLALACAAGGRNLAYFERPARGFALLGLGAAEEFAAAGADRFAAVSRAARAALERLSAGKRAPHGPLVLGGFSFFDRPASDPAWREFPPLRMVVPRILWVKRNRRTFLTLAFRDRRERALLLRRAARLSEAARAAAGAAQPSIVAGPVLAPLVLKCANGAGLPRPAEYAAAGENCRAGDEPAERARWRARVNAALRLIDRGELAKVVLARKKTRVLPSAVEPAALLARAREYRPSCLSFWIAGAKTSFIGSTPELLVRLRAGRFTCDALAGSARRAGDPARDRAQARALLASAKNAREHRLVVAAITAALEPLARELKAAKQPQTRVFFEGFHLFTPIHGALKSPLSALELAGRLHPTPAVCGVPTARARAILAAQEADRGWYAGGVGWMDARADGEFAVALRSALIERRRVVGWAGAGIVAGSDPDAEFAETEDKLGALFAGLRA
jgi:isochorismate synthase